MTGAEHKALGIERSHRRPHVSDDNPMTMPMPFSRTLGSGRAEPAERRVGLHSARQRSEKGELGGKRTVEALHAVRATVRAA